MSLKYCWSVSSYKNNNRINCLLFVLLCIVALFNFANNLHAEQYWDSDRLVLKKEYDESAYQKRPTGLQLAATAGELIR